MSAGRQRRGYRMALRDGTVYVLDADGFVLARSDGPAGWDYRRGWRIVGFATRWNAAHVIPLRDAIGADTGQGWVHDWDHGTHRMWGSPTGRRLATLERLP